MAIAAIVGLAIGFVTIGLLFYNAYLQRQATKHTLSAAEAAWESSNGAKRADAAHVHAIAVFVPGKLADDESNPLYNAMYNMRARLVVQVENVGRSVAINVRLKTKLTLEQTARRMFTFEEFDALPIPAANIAPQQQPEIEAIFRLEEVIRAIPMPDLPSVAPGDPSDFTVRGEIIYDDIFDNTYRSAFLFQLMWPLGKKEPFPSRIDAWTSPNAAPTFELVKSASQKKRDRAQRA